MDGKGVAKDIDDLVHWGKQMKNANRCGLGQTAANPILTSIENFRMEYEAKIEKGKDFDTKFDLDAAIQKALSHPGPALVEVMTDAELV